MGPEPITMAVLTSWRLGTAPPPYRGLRPLELRHEILENVLVVPRPRVGLGMVLDGEDRQLPMGHPFHRAVVQVHVSDLEFRLRQGRRIDGKAVILRGDVDPPGAEVLHGLIPAAVSELQLERLPAEGEGQKLVPEADAQERDASRELPGRLDGGRDDIRVGGISGAVRQDDAIGFQGEDLVRGRVVGHPDHLGVALSLPEDISLHTAVDHDDRALPWTRVSFEGRAARFRDEIPGFWMGGGTDFLRDLIHVLVRRHEGRLHRSLRSDSDRERARVGALDRGCLMPLQEVSEAHRAPGMTRGRASLLHDEPRRLDRLRFQGVRIHAIVPDQRVRHHEDLTAVRRIRQGFRVARHVRVENKLSQDPAPGPEERPPGHRSVLEDEGPFHSLDPHPIFDSAYEGFPLTEIPRGSTRLLRSRQFEFIQSCDHLVPVRSPPIHAATGGTTPECPMSGPDPFRHRVLHVLQRRTHEDFVAEGTTGERTDEPERKGRSYVANLIVQDIGVNPDRAGDSGREFLVPRQEDPVLGADSLDKRSIRARFRIRGVVAHEPQPTRETPQHVIAEEFHATPFEMTCISQRRARLFPARNLGLSNPGFHPSPPSSSETTKRLAARTPRWRATAQTADASISTATTPSATSCRARARDSRYTASVVHVPPGRNGWEMSSRPAAIARRTSSLGRIRRAFP